MWHDEAITVYERQAQLVREAGALAELPIHLQALALERAWRGDLPGVGDEGGPNHRSGSPECFHSESSIPTRPATRHCPWSLIERSSAHPTFRRRAVAEIRCEKIAPRRTRTDTVRGGQGGKT
jgi:hypothetical protein